MQTNGRIPGNLRTEDQAQLAELVLGRNVLQLGCYCGRGLLAIAQHALKVWVLEDFLYPGGMDAVIRELMDNVYRNVPEEKSINLLRGDARGWIVPVGSEDIPLGEIGLVYRDANRAPKHEESDGALAYEIMRRRGGVYAWHDEEHQLKWLKIEPVPVEVN